MKTAASTVILLLIGASAALERAPRNYCAHSGSKLVRNDQANCTDRGFIELYGWQAPDRNTPCGHAARLRLEDLLRSGKVFFDSETTLPRHTDAAGQYVLAYDENGDSLYKRMVREGLILEKGNAMDVETRRLYEEARAAMRGCHRASELSNVWETKSDRLETASKLAEQEDDQVSLSFASRQTTQVDPTYETDSWPTGFTTELFINEYIARPVDFLWTPSGMLMIATNEGLVYTVRGDRTLRGTPFMDVSTIVNNFQDRGLMSMVIPPDYARNPWLFFFVVYEHDPRPAQYEGPKSSRVMKVHADATGLQEDRRTRTTILGTRNGAGCDGFAADSDCIPTEGKSHVGGALAFRSDGDLYVAVGDGAIAIVTDVAVRAQRFGGYSGKVLLINQDGQGLRSNPFFNGNVNSRDSKIYAWGVRNIFNMHVSPDNDDHVFAGDTMWNDMEEVNVIRRGQNYGWPCYESFLRRPEYVTRPECRSLGANHVYPLVGWRHRDGTGSSMVGQKINIPGWPRRYRDVLIYGDMAQRFIGVCKIDGNDNLVENMERISIPDAAVQFRAGPDNALYYIGVRNRGELRRVSYRADGTRLSLSRQFPAPGSVVSTDAGLRISARFSRSVEPETVAGNIELRVRDTGAVIPTTLSFDFPSRLFTLTVRRDLPAGAALVVAVGAGVRDLDQNPPRTELSWGFNTRAMQDSVRPYVDSSEPSNNAVNIPLHAVLSISFSEPMQAGSVTSGFTIHQTSGGAPVGAPLAVQDVRYSEAARELRFRAPLTYSTQYVVTVRTGADGPRDMAGNWLRESFLLRFTTMDSADAITIDMTAPAENMLVSVGDIIRFAATARTSSGAPVPASAFAWEYNILHCDYSNENECHDHSIQTIRGVNAGSVEAADHFDRFKYELKLSVQYGGETGVLARTVDLNMVDITFASEPAGLLLSLSGDTRAAPFTLPVAVRSTMQLFAPETQNDLEFDRWAHGGDRTQDIIVNRAATYTAYYREEGSVRDTREPFVRVVEAPEFIPLTNRLTVTLAYYAPVDSIIRGNLRTISPSQFLSGGARWVPAGEGTTRLRINYREDLAPGMDVTMNLLMLSQNDRQSLTRTSVLMTTAGGTTGGISTADRLEDVTPPLPLPLTGTVTVGVEFEATEARDVVVAIFDNVSGTRHALTRVQVAATSGVQQTDVALVLRSDFVRGREYRVTATLRPVNGAHRDRVDMLVRRVVA